MNSSITELSLHIIILRIFLSTIIGGIIGYERGSNNQAAGFRTHILVCLGATLISLIQEQLKINLLNYAIENPLSSQVLKTDLGRLGAQVISGIGFLGAGTIFMYGNQIRGLVTSAGIWVMAAVGMAVGAGMYVLAIIATAITVVIQSMLSNKYFSYLDVKVPGRLRVCMDSETKSLEKLEKILSDKKIDIRSSNMKRRKDEYITYIFGISMPENIDVSEVVTDISKIHSVKFVDL